MTSISRLSVLLLGTCVMLQTPAAAAPRGFNGVLKNVIADYRASLTTESVYGSSLAVTQNGRVLAKAHYGVANKDTGQPIDDNTIFHWGSITKLFTAIAVMQLRDRGKLSLDDRIIDYLPETKQIHNPYGPMSAVTLRHLITHSSGMRARTFPWAAGHDWEPMEPTKWPQVAAMMPYSEIEFPPGSKYGYSNPGVSMLGRVVEEVAGEDIETYVTKNILMPLGMARAYFDTTPYHLQKYRPHSYYRDKDGVKDLGAEVESGATNGNSGLNAPISDMLKFADFLLNVGDNGNYDMILSRSTLAEMWQPRFELPNTATSTNRQQMGYVFFLYQDDNNPAVRLIGSTGAQQGFIGIFFVHPESRSAIVMAQNTASDDDQTYRQVRRDFATKLVPALQNTGHR